MKNDFSRRDFLKSSSCLLAASFLAACERLIPPTNTPPVLPATLNSSPTNTTSVAVTSPKAALPLVLEAPLDDFPDVFMNTYFGAVGSSIPTAQNPQGIHQGMDFVVPTGTAVKAVVSGTVSRIIKETKTEYDGTVNTYANVLFKINDQNTLDYNFEPLQSLFVAEGQVVNTGDILGTLANNRGQNRRGTEGTGTLDFGLLSVVDGSWARICFVPCSSPSFRTLMETWFSRAFTATSEHPGPCTCHYHYP
jgi:hypothetical protein